MNCLYLPSVKTVLNLDHVARVEVDLDDSGVVLSAEVYGHLESGPCLVIFYEDAQLLIYALAVSTEQILRDISHFPVTAATSGDAPTSASSPPGTP